MQMKRLLVMFFIMFSMMAFGYSIDLTTSSDYVSFLKSTGDTNVIEGRVNIDLLLKSDGRVEFSYVFMKSINQTIKDETGAVLIYLPPNESYTDIEVSDLSSETERKLKEVTVLDTNNCDGTFIYNEIQKQVLACISPIKSTEITMKLNAIMLKDTLPDICPKYADRVSKSLTLEFLVFKNNSYPIHIKVLGDSYLNVSNVNESFQNFAKIRLDEIENGFVINIPQQNWENDTLEIKLELLGFIKSEVQKIQDSNTNKQISKNKYRDQTAISLIFSVIIILINPVKLAKFEIPISLLLTLPVYNSLNGLNNDLARGYISWLEGHLPTIIAVIAFLIYLKKDAIKKSISSILNGIQNRTNSNTPDSNEQTTLADSEEHQIKSDIPKENKCLSDK